MATIPMKYPGLPSVVNTALPISTKHKPIAHMDYADDTGALIPGSGSTYSAPAPDPLAAQRAAFTAQKQNIYGSANDAAANTGLGIRSSILDLMSSGRTGQQNIDSKASRNELAKMQGVQGILGMVGRGIRSGGVMLANKNAGDSSAAGALAGAYGDQGRRQMANVGNQYEMGNEDVRLAQSQLDEQLNTGARKIGESKQSAVNNIVLDARNQFAQLDAAMANASLPERIAIEQEKENVRNQVLAQLQQYDQMLQSERSTIRPSDQNARRAEAQRLMSAGTDLGADAFQYTDETPAEFQGTGPFASELPLFSFNRNRRQQLA